MIFMNSNQFRMMRGFQEAKKINQALLRFLNLDICSVISNMQGLLNDDSTLPYRESLEYVLVRLLGATKLLVRTVVCAKKSILYFLGFTKAGSFFVKGAILLGTLSKIWNDSRVICEKLCKFYGKLLKCRESLEPGNKFLPLNFEFPESLITWLGDEWLAKVKDLDEPLQVKDEFEENDLIEYSITTKAGKSELELEDFTPLDRDELISGNKSETEIIKVPKQSKHSLKKINSIEAFQKFLKKENNYRKLDPNKALTIKKFNNKKWKVINADLQRKSVLMQEKPFIKYVKDLFSQ